LPNRKVAGEVERAESRISVPLREVDQTGQVEGEAVVS
jgi:hypothetical protein